MALSVANAEESEMSLFVKVKSSTDYYPVKATEGSSGYDLKSAEKEPVWIYPGCIYLFKTDVSIALPEGIEGQVRSRSGLAVNKGLTVLNSPGTIDSDYRGEVKVILINHSKIEQCVYPGDRIAQLVFVRVEPTMLIRVEELPKTTRGTSGFGSTG